MTAAAVAIAEMLNPGNKAHLYTFCLWRQRPAHLHIFNLWQQRLLVTLSFCVLYQQTL